MHKPWVRLFMEKRRDSDAPDLAYAREVIAHEVNDHDVFGSILWQQVSRGPPRPLNRTCFDPPGVAFEEEFR